jgi:hypothetical protein
MNSKSLSDEAPVLVTEDSVDPLFTEPYIDLNELRESPVRHRYVHGGFKGTGARFSFYSRRPSATKDAFITIPIRLRFPKTSVPSR